MTQIAREKITASDDEIETRFSDECGIGLCVSDLCFGPADEIEAFRTARKGWSDPGHIVTDAPEVFHVERAQAYRGQPRRDVALIRLGEYCAIYGMDR